MAHLQIFLNTSYLLQESFAQTIKVFLAVVVPLQLKWPILLSKLIAQLLVRIFLSCHGTIYSLENLGWFTYQHPFVWETFTYALTCSSRLSPISHKCPCFFRGKLSRTASSFPVSFFPLEPQCSIPSAISQYFCLGLHQTCWSTFEQQLHCHFLIHINLYCPQHVTDMLPCSATSIVAETSLFATWIASRETVAENSPLGSDSFLRIKEQHN